MDFERVIRTLLEGFERQRIRYGVIGGFALGALGIPRATADLDCLVHREDLESLHQLLTALRYTRDFRMENVSHYRHTDPVWGSLDVLHAFRKYALAMLERARPHPVFGGDLTINVLQPEDVIGLKIQGIANNSLRAAQEKVDIEALMAHYGRKLDWDRIQEYYALFEWSDEGRRLRERFSHAQ